jgi:hypothetical protein
VTIHKLPPRKKPAKKQASQRAPYQRDDGIDWEGCERDYSEGKFSLRELAEHYGTSTASIKRRVEKYGWVKDLAPAIEEATAHAVLEHTVKEKRRRTGEIRQQVTAKLMSFGSAPGDAEKIAAAAELNANVILQHRQDTGQSRVLAMTMMAELSIATHHPAELADAVNTLLSAEFGDETNDEKAIAQQVLRSRLTHLLDLGERAKTLDKVVSAMSKLHAMERKAHGLDSEEETPKDKRAVATKAMTDVERKHRMQYLLNKGTAKLLTNEKGAA